MWLVGSHQDLVIERAFYLRALLLQFGLNDMQLYCLSFHQDLVAAANTLLRIDFQRVKALGRMVQHSRLTLVVCNLDCSCFHLAISASDCSFVLCMFPSNFLSSMGAASVPLWWWASLSSNRYSFFQRFRNLFKVRFRCLDSLLSKLAVTSSLLSFPATGSGKLITHLPIRRCDGVSSSSKSSAET